MNVRQKSESRQARSQTRSETKRLTLYSYLKNELTRNYCPENDSAKFTERRKRVYTFFKIPIELEKFITYGYFQCLDAFLFIFTLLPLRFLRTVKKLTVNTLIKSHSEEKLDPAEICDLLKIVVLLMCCFLMSYIDVSMMYHVIRGQTVIKLYIFFNMLDVADKLCSSFGQDILDSLFWTATETRSRTRDHLGVLPHLLFAVVYVFIHTILVLLQANTLNVAFNSHNKALLTIMMSNNFVELKGSVFKKFEKSNLFQMSCSDVRERLHLTILLLIVALRNLAQFNWSLGHFWVLFPDMMLVMGCEFIVDWIKHAFITKFNDISYDVYREYNVSISYDIVGSRHPDAFSDHVDVVSRRMGFIPLPLAVLLIRVVVHSVEISSPLDVLIVLAFFICLLTLKILNSIILLGMAQTFIKTNKDIIVQSTETVQTTWATHQSFDNQDIPFDLNFVPSQTILFGRSQSLLDFGNYENNNANLLASPAEVAAADAQSLRKYSLNSPDNILFNSTVSLQSVIENETMENDLESLEVNQKAANDSNLQTNPGSVAGDNAAADSFFECGDSATPRRRRNTASRKSECSDQPLSEVDRYTMCSNRIVQ